MFYWNNKNFNVVLMDSEENDILFILGTTPEERIEYRIESATRKRLEKQIYHYLDELYKYRREEFKKYYSRSFIGDEAVNFSPILLDAYGRFSKIAIIGKYKTKDEIEKPQLFEIQKLTDDIIYENQEIFYISLINYNRISKRFKVTSVISFPKRAVEKLVGTVEKFTLLCNNFTINFNRKSVRIKLL